MFRKRFDRQTIGVSALADYAAGPVNYCERRGKVRSPGAAARGSRAHRKLTANRSATVIRWLIMVALSGYVTWLAWALVA